MEVKICTNEVLLSLLFKLMGSQNRKCVTASEVERYQRYISEKAKKQGIDVTFVYDMTDRLALIRKYIDTIVVDGKIVYRLNYSITVDNLDDLCKLLGYYQNQHIDISCENDEKFLASLNDYSSESEKESIDFKRVDIRRQLDIVYQLFMLEKQKRKLKANLGMMPLTGAVKIDDIGAEFILEQNPDITKSDFIEQMTR